MKLALPACVLVLLLSACSDDTSNNTGSSSSSSSSGSGGGGGGGGGGGMEAADKAYCQSLYDRDVKCGNMPEATQVDMCVAEEVCSRNLFNPSAFEDIRACKVARDCMTSEDSCIGTADQMQAGTAASKAYGDACMPKLAECANSGSQFSEDYCYGYKVLTDSMLEQLTACLSQPCAMVGDCLSGAYDAVFQPCGGK